MKLHLFVTAAVAALALALIDRGAVLIGDDGVVAQFLRAAPRLVGSEALAEATLGVNLFPHQQQVVERLAGMFPRSWLVADEVGLGKTISAGMALRRLIGLRRGRAGRPS